MAEESKLEEEVSVNEDNVLKQNRPENLFQSVINPENINSMLTVGQSNYDRLFRIRISMILTSLSQIFTSMYVDHELFKEKNVYLKLGEILPVVVFAITVSQLLWDDYIRSYYIELENKRIAELGISNYRKREVKINRPNYSQLNFDDKNLPSRWTRGEGN